MVVSAAAGVRANLDGASGLGMEVGVRMLEKANNLVDQQGQAMVEMIENSVVDPAQGRIDARA